MKTFQFQWEDVAATVYLLDKGEDVPRHRHDVSHNTCVIAGSTVTRIFDIQDAPYLHSLAPGDFVFLPAGIDHEITAAEDGTIIINMIRSGALQYDPVPQERAQDGGVALHEDQP